MQCYYDHFFPKWLPHPVWPPNMNSKVLQVNTIGQILRNVYMLPDNTVLHLNSLPIKNFVA